MKFLPLILFLASTAAHAWPGSETVKCSSLPGAAKKVELLLSMTGTATPDMPALVSFSVDAVRVSLDEPERPAIAIMAQPRDKVITASYGEWSMERTVRIRMSAKPRTIRGSRDSQCRDDYKFRADVSVYYYTPAESASAYDQVMDCEYESTPGSAGC